MMWSVRRLRQRVRSLFRKKALDEALKQELEFHLAEQEAEYLSSGMPVDDAKAAAHRLFGSKSLLEEQCRDQRRTRWADDFVQDVRFALRSFSKSPGFTFVAVVTLALGIGVNAAFFSTAYGIVLRPLPYPAPQRLIDMQNGIAGVGPVTALRDLARAADYAGYIPDDSRTIEQGGQALRVKAATVTWNLGRVLRVAPARGRWFQKDEERKGRNRVVVLSDAIWRGRFAADPMILGSRIELNEESYEVVGVMGPGFAFPSPDTELWVPLLLDSRDIGYVWGGSNLWPIGRLREGMTLAATQAELKPAIDRIRGMFPWRMPDAWGRGASVGLHSESMVKDVRPKLLALSTASLLLLLIACGNVANLLLARSVKREREFAMREALGARRGRLLRQLLTENLLLAIAGGVAGLLAAALILQVLPSILPKTTPRLHEIIPDFILVLAASASMSLTLLLFGVTPLIQALRRSRASLIGRAVTATRRTVTLSLTLIGMELALATTLLIGAGLMGRTLWNLANVDSGVHTRGVVTAQVSAGPSRCRGAATCWALLQSLNKTLIGMPEAQSVNWSNLAPLGQEISAMAVEVQDHPKPPGAPAYVLWNTAVTSGYFHALGIPMHSGRTFSDADRDGTSPVVIISESTAQRFWPHESAIGKRISAMSEARWRTVIGVAGDVSQYSLTGFPDWIDGVQYLPLAQWMPRASSGMEETVLVELAHPQASVSLVDAVRRQFPDVVLSHVRSLEGIRSESIADQRSTAWLLTLFAALGLLLGVAGVYGVISHRAAQRTREIGIRIALGASSGRVAAMILIETLSISVAGTGVGVLISFGLSRFLGSLLFGVTTHDSTTLLMAPLALLTAALLSAAVPGVRAARTDPAVTLRED